jgi:hypothetical protein
VLRKGKHVLLRQRHPSYCQLVKVGEIKISCEERQGRTSNGYEIYTRVIGVWCLHSKLIRYAKICVQCSDFLERGQLLSEKLPRDKSNLGKLESSLRKFYVRHREFLVFLFRHLCSNYVFGMVTWSLIENRMWYRRKDTLRSILNIIRSETYETMYLIMSRSSILTFLQIYGFDHPIVNFSFLGRNIPTSSAYGVYIQNWSATLKFVSNAVTS